MKLQRLLIVGGVLNLCFAVFHCLLPWIFRWDVGLRSLSVPDTAFVYTSHCVIIMLLLSFAYASFFTRADLLGTRLGRIVLFMIGAVWLIRSATEVLVFKIGEEGAWWRLVIFMAIAAIYEWPVVVAPRIWVTPPNSISNESAGIAAEQR